MKEKILFTEELIHPIFYIIPTSLGIYSIFDLFIFEDNFTLRAVVSFVITIVIYKLIKMSRTIILKNDIITKGIFISPIGIVKSSFKIPLITIDEIFIEQKQNKYFGIFIQTKDNIKHELTAIPNRNPAKEELERIKQLLNFK